MAEVVETPELGYVRNHIGQLEPANLSAMSDLSGASGEPLSVSFGAAPVVDESNINENINAGPSSSPARGGGFAPSAPTGRLRRLRALSNAASTASCQKGESPSANAVVAVREVSNLSLLSSRGDALRPVVMSPPATSSGRSTPQRFNCIVVTDADDTTPAPPPANGRSRSNANFNVASIKAVLERLGSRFGAADALKAASGHISSASSNAGDDDNQSDDDAARQRRQSRISGMIDLMGIDGIDMLPDSFGGGSYSDFADVQGALRSQNDASSLGNYSVGSTGGDLMPQARTLLGADQQQGEGDVAAYLESQREHPVDHMLLHGFKLASVPNELIAFTWLRCVTLADNALTSVPDALFGGAMPCLEEIDMSANRLTALPHTVFTSCPTLTQLIVDHNALTEFGGGVPAAEWNLPVLREIGLEWNALHEFPVTVLRRLPLLRRLFLSENASMALSIDALEGLFMWCACCMQPSQPAGDDDPAEHSTRSAAAVAPNLHDLANASTAAVASVNSFLELSASGTLLRADDMLVIKMDNAPAIKELLLAPAVAQLRDGHNVSIEWNEVFPDRILDGLYLGGIKSVQSAAVFERLGVTHVLSAMRVTSNAQRPALSDGLTHKELRLDDLPGEDITLFFDEAHAFIDTARSDGGGVAVHCFMGMSRSATVVVSYLMKTLRMSFEDAIALVRQHRNVAPNDGYVLALRKYGEQLAGQWALQVGPGAADSGADSGAAQAAPADDDEALALTTSHAVFPSPTAAALPPLAPASAPRRRSNDATATSPHRVDDDEQPALSLLRRRSSRGFASAEAGPRSRRGSDGLVLDLKLPPTGGSSDNESDDNLPQPLGGAARFRAVQGVTESSSVVSERLMICPDCRSRSPLLPLVLRGHCGSTTAHADERVCRYSDTLSSNCRSSDQGGNESLLTSPLEVLTPTLIDADWRGGNCSATHTLVPAKPPPKRGAPSSPRSLRMTMTATFDSDARAIDTDTDRVVRVASAPSPSAFMGVPFTGSPTQLPSCRRSPLTNRLSRSGAGSDADLNAAAESVEVMV